MATFDQKTSELDHGGNPTNNDRIFAARGPFTPGSNVYFAPSDLLGGAVTPQMFGADGTAANDTAALLAAIAAVDGTGGKIFLPPGELTINQTIEIETGAIIIEGSGRGASIINHAVIGAPLFLVTGATVRVDFRDFRVTGNGVSGGSGSGHAFALHDPDVDTGSRVPQLVNMERLTITDCQGTGLEGASGDSLGTITACALAIKGALGCNFTDIEVQDCGGGVYVTRSQNCVFEQLNISNCNSFGFLDYRNDALRLQEGDIQDCTNGTAITVPITLTSANIISYLSSGTQIDGVKTKDAGAGSQIYVEEGIGVAVRRCWLQASMTADVDHKGIVAKNCSGLVIEGNTIEGTTTAYTGKKYTFIELVPTNTAPSISGCVRNNQFTWPPGMGVAAGISIIGNAGTRLVDGLIIENNVFGSRSHLTSACAIDAIISVATCTLKNSKIAYNAGNLWNNATATVGVLFSSVTQSGRNVIEQNDFTVAGTGVLTSRYSGITESELFGSATFNPADLVDGAGETTTVTVTGAALGDYAQASFSLDLQGIMLTAWVSAADTVSVRFQNETTGTINLASGTLRARVKKS